MLKRRNLLMISAGIILSLFFGTLGHASLVKTFKFDSKFLKRQYQANVYLPFRYKSSGLKYPVLYLLHGSDGNGDTWIKNGDIRKIADTLIAERKIPPCIIIMPSHYNAWWVNGNREPAETVFFMELIPKIDKAYRTINDRSGRAIAGVSAGGYGAVLYIFKHPDMFAAAATLSPTIFTPLPPEGSPAYESHPFIDANRQFEEETWKRLNYTNFIGDYFRQNLKVPLYICSGDHDRFDVTYHAATLYKRVREFQPELVELRVVDGDHDWKVWSETIGNAMIYMLRFVSKPLPLDQPAGTQK